MIVGTYPVRIPRISTRDSGLAAYALTFTMQSPLRYEQSAHAIYDALRNIPRTGWVMSGVPDPETVYDHTVALVELASDLASDLALDPQELDTLQLILEVHDWPEAIVGDEVILDKNPDDHQVSKVNKHKQEAAAMQTLCAEYDFGPTALAAWLQYEEQATDIAQLAKELDKYQAVELALTYEAQTGIPLFAEFDTYSQQHITNPVLIARLAQLRERHTNLLSQ